MFPIKRLVAFGLCAALCLWGGAGVAIADQQGGFGMDEYCLRSTDIGVKTAGNAVADGQTDDTAAINTAINKAREEGKRLIFEKGTYLVEKNLNFPSAISVVFEEGAMLKLGSSARVSINSVLLAGNWKIFEGTQGSLQVNSTVSGNPFWFGAKGDGKTDDTAAFVQGYRIFTELKLPYTQEGYLLTGLELLPNMSLTSADSKKAIIKASKETNRLFNVAVSGVRISDLQFEMGDAPTGSTVFYFDTAKTYIEKIYVKDCIFRDAYHVFSDAKDKNVMMHMHFEDLEFYDSRHSTYRIEDFEGFIFMKRIKIDNSGSYQKHKLDYGFPAIQIDDVRGTIFEEMELIGANSGYQEETGFLIPSKVGFMASVWWDRVTVKNMSGYGITVGATIICTLINTTVSDCGGGVYLQKAMELQMDKVTVTNSTGGEGATELQGILLENCERTQLHQVTSTGNAGCGVYLKNCSSMILNDCEFTGNQSFGFREVGGGRNIFQNSRCYDNDGQITVSASNTVVSDVETKKGSAISFKGADRID